VADRPLSVFRVVRVCMRNLEPGTQNQSLCCGGQVAVPARILELPVAGEVAENEEELPAVVGVVVWRIACVSAAPNSCAFGPLHALDTTVRASAAIVITLRIVLSCPFPSGVMKRRSSVSAYPLSMTTRTQSV
jgi:hypothetical protein